MEYVLLLLLLILVIMISINLNNLLARTKRIETKYQHTRYLIKEMHKLMLDNSPKDNSKEPEKIPNTVAEYQKSNDKLTASEIAGRVAKYSQSRTPVKIQEITKTVLKTQESTSNVTKKPAIQETKAKVETTISNSIQKATYKEVQENSKVPFSNGFEEKTYEILNNIWQWIIVGENFRRQNIAKEYAIATTWLVRFSIIMLLAGGGYFLKYSIDNNLVSYTTRVIMTIICGVSLIGGGLKITGHKKQYDLIGRGLIGGGIALLYFSIFSAFQLYHLIDQLPAFAFMILVTVLASFIAIKKRLLLVAIIGIIGGYITPVILANGTKNLYGLFTYLAILGIGTLFISRYRGWKLLNIISFVLTYLIFHVALERFYNSDMINDYYAVVLFSSVYFVLFSVMAIIYNIYKRQIVTMIELVALLANTAIFLATNWYYTSTLFNRHYVAFFTFSAAIFFIFNILFLKQKKYKDQNLLTILTGLSVLSIVMTFPLALSGVWITASWSFLGLFLLYTALKLKSKIIFIGSFIVYLLAIFRVFIFDKAFYIFSIAEKNRLIADYKSEYTEHLIDGLLSGGILALVMILGAVLIKKYRNEMAIISQQLEIPNAKTNTVFQSLFLYSGVILFFAFSYTEILNIGDIFTPNLNELLQFTLITSLAVFFMIRLKLTKHSALVPALLITLVIMIIKLLYLLKVYNFSMKTWCYGTEFSFFELAMRAIIIVAFFAVLYFFKRILISIKRFDIVPFIKVAIISTLFGYLSVELSSALYFFLPQFRSGGVSVYWAIFALTMIFFGLKNNVKELRYCSLILLAIDILKIFFIDLQHLGAIPKVIALIATSLLLMAGAFIYIKAQSIFVSSDSDEV